MATVAAPSFARAASLSAQQCRAGPSLQGCSVSLAPCSRQAREQGAFALQKDLLGASLAFAAGASRSASQVPRRLRVEAAKRVQTGRSLVLNSTLIAEKGNEDAVAKLCKGMLSLADEKKKDRQAGIITFECHSDPFEPNVVHFWERYDTFVAMNDFHAAQEYTKFLEEVRPLLSSPVLLAAYEYKDGQLGCMLNPIGPKGEGGLDDATGQGGSGGGASYKQTSQSVQQGLSEAEERGSWGLEKALQASSAKGAAQEAAAALAKSLKSIFGAKK